MPHKLKVIINNQKGFTLIELLAVVAIFGLIGSGVATAIYQMWNISVDSTNRVTAVKQVENAIHWISRDAQMAQVVQTSGAAGFPLSLSWVDWDNIANQVSYALDDDKICRSYSVGGGAPSETVVAEYISSDTTMTKCYYLGGVLNLKLTAMVGGFKPSSETRECEIIPRPVP